MSKMPHSPQHKVPDITKRGDRNELKKDLVDPSAEVEPSLGHEPFLIWVTKEENGEKISIAEGKDGTVYKIVPDEPPIPPQARKYKIITLPDKIPLEDRGKIN
jgi:hypothetical protein